MAKFVTDESSYINSNIFKYEDRMQSKFSRFTGNAPTMTTYFHINDEESSVDEGLGNVEEILGPNSPVRFNKIENMPMGNLESIILQLSNEEQGLDTSYEGETTIYPTTIKPYQNDFFIINHIGNKYIFKVTAISYDVIKPDNYYKISIKLEYVGEEYYKRLLELTVDNYSCILDNIGSENKSIIKTVLYDSINNAKRVYRDLVENYCAVYYNKRYNSLLCELNANLKIYDPYLTKFINTHNLFNDENSYETILLNTEYIDRFEEIKYNKSFYKLIERQSTDKLNRFYYDLFPALIVKESTFAMWNDSKIFIVDIPRGNIQNGARYLLSDKFIEDVNINNKMDSVYSTIIKKYLLKEKISIDEINDDLVAPLLDFDNNEELFFFIPVILYIIKKIISDELKINDPNYITHTKIED